ncbi:hypothetical protein FNV43_RR20346 [Rhamnella rubrinervis]|uniref:Uncharacterized protein n=1 Tax=Rhamnella rubrinervis TaxID=2594499 RepID=A0A8K0GWZ0_9ROSA|nr:hypothetical protein FNV43_RR20346 [Rhamnella rubrinervis]
MQCNSYFPGYYSTRNLKMDANGSTWPLNYDDKTLKSEYCYSGFFLPLSPAQVLGFNKEVLKQTMLKHETIFRDQIQELHRLYRRQRELMDELRRDELHKLDHRYEVSQSMIALSQSSSEFAQKTIQVSSLPLVNPLHTEMSLLGLENAHSPLSLVQGKNMQACFYPGKREGCNKDFHIPEIKCKKFGKKILDLQLPADEYIDSDNEEFSEVPMVSSLSLERSQFVYNSDVKPVSGNNGLNSVSRDDTVSPASMLKKLKGLTPEEEVAPMSSQRELVCCELAGKRQSGSQVSLKEFFQNTKTKVDLEACSSLLPSETERKKEWQSCNDEAGKTGSNFNSYLKGFNAKKSSMLSKSSHGDPEQAHAPPTFHQSNRNSCSERTTCSLVSSKKNFDLQNDGHSEHRGASYACNSNEDVPERDMIPRSSSLVNSRKCHDSERTPIAVQALPCFVNSVPLGKRTKSTVGRPGFAGDMRYHNKNSGCSPKLDGATNLNSFYSNVSQPDSRISEADPQSIRFDDLCRIDDDTFVTDYHFLINHKNSSKAKTSKDINLNSMPLGCSSDFTISQRIQNTHGVERHEDSVGGLPWLKAKPVCNGEANKGCEGSTQAESVVSQAYSASIHDVEQKQGGASDSSCKRTIGIPNNNKPYVLRGHCSSSGAPFKTFQNPFADIKSKEEDVVLDLNRAFNSLCESEIKLTADDHVTENGPNGKLVGFGDHIDLNSSTNENEFSHCGTIEIDLEAPVSPENKECSPPRGESDENQVETPCLCSGEEDAEVQDELARIAAESIISISSSGFQNCNIPEACKLSDASNTSLDWFAGIVSSVVSDPENELRVILDAKDGGRHAEVLPDGMDYFEAMTLKLTETKVEEYCCRSNIPKKEEIATSAPPSQPRKGRTRRGRQRKDFQSEILPSLASLSRYEVTEDLQTIGGLMEAAGTCLETGPLRYVARNGYVRGRKRSSASTSSGLDGTAGSLQKQLISSNTKAANEERSLICWGKVTRRRRGQRYRVSNPQLIPNQV